MTFNISMTLNYVLALSVAIFGLNIGSDIIILVGGWYIIGFSFTFMLLGMIRFTILDELQSANRRLVWESHKKAMKWGKGGTE